MKAILVLNEMPKCCDGCPCTDYMFCYATQKELEIDWEMNKPSWCPLKPMPHKLQADWYTDGYKEGFNACLDEIVGETE